MCFFTGAALAEIAAGTTLAETASPFVVSAAAAPAASAAGASWLPYASAGLSLLGTGASIMGTLGRGESDAQTAAYRAQVARNNETIANEQADQELMAGKRQAEMKSLETASRVARVRSTMASNGVDISTGSALDVQASERELGAIDAETALSNSQLRAYGYRARSGAYGASAGLESRAASSSRTGSYLEAGGTLLSRASQLPLLWRVGQAA